MKRFKKPGIFLGVGLLILLVGLVIRSQMSQSRPIKTPHFVDSTPLHDQVYAAQPINVTINFNFDLAAESQISLKSGGRTDWVEGETLIEDNRTALKRILKPNLPDGRYRVDYKACFSNRSCHYGRYSFEIKSAGQSQYTDLRGKPQITIEMSDLKFKPSEVIISPNTRVTWVNRQNGTHFVNTETHPEHTYFPAQNSLEIPEQGNFSAKFDMPGQYNYHCSAHVPEGMLGSLIVKP